MFFRSFFHTTLPVLWGAFLAPLWAEEMTLSTFLDSSARVDPLMVEARYRRELTPIAEKELVHQAILPKFEITLGVGLYPGTIRGEFRVDSITGKVKEENDRYDFTSYAPMFLTGVQLVQPLNFGRLRLGQRALRAGELVEEWKIQHQELKREVELQSYWYGRLYALEMVELAKEAKRHFDKLLNHVEELLDEGDESVTQDDYLEMKIALHSLREGEAQANEGLKSAEIALAFALNLAVDSSVSIADSHLTIRPEAIPSFEQLRQALGERHPELKQLQYGLEARRRQVELEAASLGPDLFVFGKVEYSNVWSLGEHEKFRRDQTDNIDGALGVGLRYKINVWNSNDKLKRQRWELGSLQRKGNYALSGLESKLAVQYENTLARRAEAESAEEALRSAESLLKGVALRYDLDPAEGRKLISAFQTRLKAKMNWAKAVYTYNNSYAELMAAAGVPFRDYLRLGQ